MTLKYDKIEEIEKGTKINIILYYFVIREVVVYATSESKDYKF